MHNEILFTLVRTLVKRFIESFHAVGHFSTLFVVFWLDGSSSYRHLCT